MIKVLIDDKIVELNSLNDLDLEALVSKCKSYSEDGDRIILAISPVRPEWKEYYRNRPEWQERYGNSFEESIDYTIGYGEYLD